jgi:hypothetical protein
MTSSQEEYTTATKCKCYFTDICIHVDCVVG